MSYRKAREIAIEKFWIVFFYSGISSFLPLIIAMTKEDSRYILMVPFLNACLYAIERYIKERKIIDLIELNLNRDKNQT